MTDIGIKLESITSFPAFSKLKIVDMDTHWSEPPDLWTSRAPASLKGKMPRIEETKDGRFWVIGEEATPVSKASPVSVVNKQGLKARGGDFLASEYEHVHEASYDLKKRLSFMDAFGIHTQILYPNVGGIGYTYFRSNDNELKTAVTQIYNDAAAEIQADTNNRILPMAVIPFWDIKDALKELERSQKMGLHGIVMGGDVHIAGMPDLGQDYWKPFWEACQDYDVPINFHIGGSDLAAQTLKNASWPTFGAEAWLALGSAVMYVDNARVISNLIFAGVPEKFPKLKFVSVESGVGWLRFFLEALDYQLIETASSVADTLSMKPSDYFKRNFYSSFWFESSITDALEFLGDDKIMFETDFPHPTCLYPGPLDFLKKSVAHLPAATQEKLLQNNAAKLYKVDLS